MNDSRLKEFRALIQTRLSELAQEDTLGQQAQAVVTLDQQSVGRLSRMDALQSQAMAKAQQTRRNLLTQQLRTALQRIENGEFGACEDCGDWISEKRLTLNPTALKCISCASG